MALETPSLYIIYCLLQAKLQKQSPLRVRISCVWWVETWNRLYWKSWNINFVSKIQPVPSSSYLVHYSKKFDCYSLTTLFSGIVLLINSIMIGQEPKNLPIAIVNMENDCSENYYKTSCEANLLGCYFQQSLNESSLVNLIPYKNITQVSCLKCHSNWSDRSLGEDINHKTLIKTTKNMQNNSNYGLV